MRSYRNEIEKKIANNLNSISLEWNRQFQNGTIFDSEKLYRQNHYFFFESRLFFLVLVCQSYDSMFCLHRKYTQTAVVNLSWCVFSYYLRYEIKKKMQIQHKCSTAFDYFCYIFFLAEISFMSALSLSHYIANDLR